MALSAARAPWAPPESFDGYRLVRLLGRGGMGQIYLGHDTSLDRPVAVKLIAAFRPDAAQRQRFLVEARALARLSHPNVLQIHRVGEVEGRPYLVAELVRGETLAELRLPVPVERVIRIGLDLARGLGAAHRRGVLHRDIKPANAMVTEDAEAKLIDFGLAKLLEEPDPGAAGEAQPDASASHASGADRSGERVAGGAATGAGALLGTPLYMAPEVIRGAPATRQSDVYALGAVLYELCAGAPPREMAGQGTDLEAWIDAAPASLRVVGSAGERLAEVIARCLDRDPARRYPSGESLADALEAIELDDDPGPVPEGNPYRGLEPFEAEHRALFFGRGLEIRAVLDRLRAEPLVLIAGDSGVGKSSLCRAGVLPQIAERGLGDGRAYTAVTLLPGRRPLDELAAALAPVLGARALSPEALDALPEALADAAQRARGVLVFVDQLEEMFTVSDAAEAARFAEVIARIGSVAAGARVLATVRGDFFTRLASLPILGDALERALYVLRPLSPEGVRVAITGPARRKGAGFAPEAMVDVLIASATQAPGGLPLLQFALAELWDARDPATARITASALESLGGVAGALARHADAVLAALGPEHQAAARAILLRLVTGDGARIRRSAAELGLSAERRRAALEALVRGRLVVARDAGGATAYELAHEALLQGWEALRGWIEADRAARRARERVAAAAAEWARLGRTPEALWSARQLADAAAIDEAELGDEERAFLSASRRLRRRARLARAAALAAAPLAVALALGGIRLKARHDLEAVIERHGAAARASADAGRAQKADAARLRQDAFAAFDATFGQEAAEARARAEAAERIWAAALEAGRRAEAALAQASQDLEAALAFDPGRAALRADLGDLLVQRIELAEWFQHDERRQDLVQRLALHDDSGERRRWLAAPPRLWLTAPPGTEITLARYEAEDSLHLLGPEAKLGRAPLEGMAIQGGPGSYLLTLRCEGRAEVRYPALLGRGEALRLDLDLPAASAIPEGFLYVPPGRFLFGSADVEALRRGMLSTQPQRELRTGPYLIGRTEVTLGAWIEFLRALPPEERAQRAPGSRNRQWGVQLAELPGGAWELTLFLRDQPVTAREGELLRIPARDRRAAQDWLRFPVTAVSLADARAYMAWLDRTGRVPGARLCDEREWERAARGADGRLFPHADRLGPDDANFDETYGRVSAAYGPDEVGSHPASASPFGGLDLVGNVFDVTSSARTPGEVLIRGGAWYYDQISARSNNRTVIEPETRDHMVGLRVCADFPPR